MSEQDIGTLLLIDFFNEISVQIHSSRKTVNREDKNDI